MGWNMGLVHWVKVGVRVVGSPSWESMVPMPYADASTWRMNHLSKFYCMRTGLEHICVFNSSNALNCHSPQCQGVVFFVRSSNGLAIVE